MKFSVAVFKLFSMLTWLVSLNLTATVAVAQVRGDQTLPNGENTVVTTLDSTYSITAGSSQGNNLFHSFEQFSLSEGEIALFDHPDNIDVIIGRVTGGSSSNINGIIRTEALTSQADLFLINPQGIVFGPSAALEIGGSFIGSTADKIIFTDGVEFSATDTQPALLSVTQPLGLVLGQDASNIVNESISNDPAFGFSAGLQVIPGQTIALVGNGIEIPGGRIVSLSSQVELASVAPGRTVFLSAEENAAGEQTWAVDYRNAADLKFQDIQLSDGALIETASDFSDSPNGQIEIRGRRISIDNSTVDNTNYGSVQGGSIAIVAAEQFAIRNQSLIAAATVTDGDGGNLTIDAPEGTIEIVGSSRLLVQPQEGSMGNGGTLTLNASQLSIQDGSTVSTSTFGNGKGGALTLNVPTGRVELLGDSRLLAQSEAMASGAGGTLTINALRLSVREGSDIATATFGNGLGGNLIINTPNGVTEIIGIPNDSSQRSALSSRSQSSERAGEIQINTRDLRVDDGGQIQAGTSGAGNGGGILINATESVSVRGESENLISQILSSSGTNTGNAGSVEIVTRRLSVEDGGVITTSTNGDGDGGDLIILSENVILAGEGTFPSGLFARTGGPGDSGRLTVIADTLAIQDGARITVSTNEEANPNNLGTVREANITARSMTLNNGQITAESLSNDGGNLTFNVQDAILLRNNALISATAGTAEAGGDGGNVNINTPNGFVIAVPNENSDIIANAFSGMGGNIDITTQNIIGLDARRATAGNTTNDIDASSQFGSDGTIVLNNLDLDPAQGLIELPANTEAPRQVAQRCAVDSGQQGAFVMTGQGGTPPSPRDVVRNAAIGLIDLGDQNRGNVAMEQTMEQAITPAFGDRALLRPTETPLPEAPLVEAQAWQKDTQGNVVLMARSTDLQPENNSSAPACNHPRR